MLMQQAQKLLLVRLQQPHLEQVLMLVIEKLVSLNLESKYIYHVAVMAVTTHQSIPCSE
jgi:hypothetical protein